MNVRMTYPTATLETGSPTVSIIVTTYQRPLSLDKVLTSLVCQDYQGKYEIIVADDGSADDTREVVRHHAAAGQFPVHFVTHLHRGFELARCRNEGMKASRAPYLIFLDGDCVAPPNFLTRHLQLRKKNSAVAGFTCHLTREKSEWLGQSIIRRGDHWGWADRSAFRKLNKLDRKANFYRLLRHNSKPRLRGGNFGVWRSDYPRVNGFDESFVGWGCEDDDFGMRLRRAGVSIKNAFRAIPTFHLWHPVDATAPKKWRDGDNTDYLHRKIRWTRCLNGLQKRSRSDLRIRIAANQRQRIWLRPYLGSATILRPDESKRADIEILVDPEKGGFRGDADCQVLAMPNRVQRLPAAAKKANLILSDNVVDGLENREQIPLSEFQNFLELAMMRKTKVEIQAAVV